MRQGRGRGGAMTGVGLQIVGGGTDNHLRRVDLRSKGLTGKVAEESLNEAGITVNKNTVPKETQSPFVTSGIRVGTPAITTRGFGVEECRQVATMMCDVLDHLGDAAVEKQVAERVMALCRRFPVPA